METKVNYTIAGIFVVSLGLAMIAIAFWMTMDRTSKVYEIYVVYMNEAVSGLSIQSPVKFNGVQVGYVDKIDLNLNNPQQVILQLKIQQGTPITVSTTATLLSQGVTGITYVGLKAETANPILLKAKHGQAYPEIPSKPSFLVQIDTALRKVTDNIDTITQTFAKVFDDQNASAVKNILQNIQKTTKVIANNSQSIDVALSQLKPLVNNIKQAGKTMTTTLQKGSDSLQAFNTQVLPQLVELLQGLNRVAGNANVLAKQLSNNPSVLVRGRAPRRLGPGER